MSIQEEAAGAFQPVVRALDADRDAEAVKRFKEVVLGAPRIRRLDPLALAKLLGRARTTALVQAFAKHPCMACRQGLLLCEDCDGRGNFRDGRICDDCLGLGAANCSFCAGSGRITYNYVPRGLRPAVVLTRTRLALAEARTLLAAAPASQAAKNRKAVAKAILSCNRLLGAFNNAIGAAHASKASSAAPAIFEKVTAASAKAAAKLERRTRRLLALLSESARLDSERSTDAERRRLAERRAAFYAGLARKASFVGTALYHPYLARIKAKGKTGRPATVESE